LNEGIENRKHAHIHQPETLRQSFPGIQVMVSEPFSVGFQESFQSLKGIETAILIQSEPKSGRIPSATERDGFEVRFLSIHRFFLKKTENTPTILPRYSGKGFRAFFGRFSEEGD